MRRPGALSPTSSPFVSPSCPSPRCGEAESTTSAMGQNRSRQRRHARSGREVAKRSFGGEVDGSAARRIDPRAARRRTDPRAAHRCPLADAAATALITFVAVGDGRERERGEGGRVRRVTAAGEIGRGRTTMAPRWEGRQRR